MFTENVMRTKPRTFSLHSFTAKNSFSATFSVVCARNCVFLRVFALSDRAAGRTGRKENGFESFHKLKAVKDLGEHSESLISNGG